jgi:hypothetical protein
VEVFRSIFLYAFSTSPIFSTTLSLVIHLLWMS